jgi:hypothetical protein
MCCIAAWRGGFALGIDDPGVPDGWYRRRSITLSEYRNYAAMRIDTLVAKRQGDRI